MTRRSLLLLFLTLGLAFFQLGGTTLFDVDEAVFSEASREMLETGDWLTPTYNYENRYDKPILFYWLQATAFRFLGVCEFSARLPSALAAVSLLLFLFLSLRRLEGEGTAFWATLSLLVCIEFTAYGHAAVTDMMLALWISVSILFYLRSQREPSAFGPVAGFYLGSALAFLTKGLIGIVFPWAVVLLHSAYSRRVTFRHLFSLKGILLFLAVGMPWYVMEFRENGMEFFNALFMKHHVARFLEVNSGHSGSGWYYLPVLFLGFFPWIVFVPRGLFRAFREDSPTGVVAGIWFLFVVIFFSFSNTKLPNYILSAFPPAAVLAGREIVALRRNSRGRIEAGILSACAVLLAGAFFYAPRLLAGENMELSGAGVLGGLMLLIGLGSGVVALGNLYRKAMEGFLAGAMVLVLVSALGLVLPAINEELQGDLHRFALEARGEPLGTFHINVPSVVFYYEGRVDLFRSDKDLPSVADLPDRYRMIARRKHVAGLENRGFVLEREGKRYALLRVGSNLQKPESGSQNSG